MSYTQDEQRFLKSILLEYWISYVSRGRSSDLILYVDLLSFFFPPACFSRQNEAACNVFVIHSTARRCRHKSLIIILSCTRGSHYASGEEKAAFIHASSSSDKISSYIFTCTGSKAKCP